MKRLAGLTLVVLSALALTARAQAPTPLAAQDRAAVTTFELRGPAAPGRDRCECW